MKKSENVWNLSLWEIGHSLLTSYIIFNTLKKCIGSFFLVINLIILNVALILN